MFKRVVSLLIICFSLPSVFASCVKPQPRVLRTDRTPGMVFLDDNNFPTVRAAQAAALLEVPALALTETDLCYKFAPKWGVGGLRDGIPGEFRHIERGTRMGWCQIELYGDLTYKTYTGTKHNPTTDIVEKNSTFIEDSVTRSVYDLNEGIDWPMKDCSKLPPSCVDGFAALRTSNNMLNNTTVGLINGDKSSIVQNWTCIKI